MKINDDYAVKGTIQAKEVTVAPSDKMLRCDIAKCLLQGMFSNVRFMESTASKADKANRDPREFLIETAIYYADELINQLKEH